MKEHPILFKAEMVRALLAGIKTQTRRTNLKTKYAVGDRLWVRETFHDEGDGRVFYRADNFKGLEDFKGWRPSLFMPRWASRVTLEVTAVREERLRDISDDDAIDEGIIEEWGIVGATAAGGFHTEIMGNVYYIDRQKDEGWVNAVDAYKALWISINGPGSWDLNPVVKVITFKVVGQS